MEWFTDPILCQRRIDDLHAQPAYATAFAAFQDGEDLSQPQMKLIRQMERATARLAELKGLSQVASDLTQLPGSDRLELTRNDDGKDKGLRKQFLETQHHFVAHSASQLALKDAKKELEGVELPENVTLALEFLSETAEKGIARAKARAKILALVSDKGPEVGWKICEKLERKSYAEDEEDEKLMRKAEKEVKAEKIHAAQAAAAKGRTKGLGRGSELSEEEIVEAIPLCEQGVPVPRVAGRLRERASFWRTFVRSSYVMSWIERGFNLKFKDGRAPPRVHLPNHVSAVRHTAFVTDVVQECVLMGALREVPSKPRVVLPLMVDDSRDKLRLIFNGKWLNAFLIFPKFKYEHLQPFVDLLRREDGLFYSDYKSGYYHVDLHEMSRTYVAVEWQGRFFEFCVLPFGLAPACWVFTKINKELVGKWRGLGFRVHPYVDDFAFAVRAPTLTDPSALAVLSRIMRDVREAGWLVSESKSQLFFTRALVHIGIGIDLEGGVLFVPEKALGKIRACVSDLLRLFHRLPLRLVAKFAGLVNAQWFVLGGVTRLYARAAAVLIADTLTWGSWASHVPGTDALRTELEFWLTDGFRRHQRGIWEPRGAGLQLETVHADTSEVAWGSWLEQSFGGPELLGHSYLTMSDRLKSSTLRELRGIFDSLRAFDVAGRLRGKRVLVICDNQSVHFVIESGSRHQELQELALAVHDLCADHGVVLSSLWMPREFEARADALSKIRDHDDWMVNPAIFRWADPWIAGGWRHTRDRFATDKNCLVFDNAGAPSFNSAWHCPGTSGVDTFGQTDWREHVNWCNPPFRMIGRLLLFLQAERAAASIVAPVWTFQPWWVLLCPDGVHLADCVVQWTELQPSADTFLPGLGRANEGGGTGEQWAGLQFSVTDPLEMQLRADMLLAVSGTREASTMRGYSRVFVRYQAFCQDRDPPRVPVPADPVTVAMYLQYIANAARTFSVVKTASAMVFTAHDLALVPADRNPTSHRLVAAVREAAHRRLGDRRLNRKEPLEFAFVQSGARCWLMLGGVTRQMFATLGLDMWTGFWRYDCAEKVRLRDMKFCETHMTTFLEKRKTDKYRYGQLVEVARAAEGQPLCPVEVSQRWVDTQIARGVQPDEPLFQQIDGRRFQRDPSADCLTGKRLDYPQLRRYLFRMLGEASGLDPDALRQLYGTQSLRSGGATAVAAADQVTDFEFNQYGGWSSSAAAATYKATNLNRRLAVSRSMPHAQQSTDEERPLSVQELQDLEDLEQLGSELEAVQIRPAEGQSAH
ncbi:hypothetical protein CYMTET_43721 [Cymbomonas tetramitiformis]|uniref:Reverse transcriptase domain-containing protein n=1 Tax=Cymbomonas tetramitiformis TaxID=36881 RepID=A0AAE0F097_9CHLO|nr:hypothetical protein CYMTET_43721 [Cymbomonas tetramitiformis]